MVWNLTSDEVVRHWDLIKFGTNQVRKPPDPERYFLGMLKEILSGKVQVWFLADEGRNIKAMALTRITGNIAGINELEINELYGYSIMTPEEHQEAFDTFVKFAKNQKLYSVIASTPHPRVASLMQKVGMTKMHETYKLRLEGDR